MRFFVLIFFLFVCSSFQAQQWQKIKLDSIEVLMPGDYKINNKSLNTSIGMLDTKSITCKPNSSASNFFYSLNITSYPKDFSLSVDNNFIDTMMITSIEELALNLKSKIVYNTKDVISGKAGYVFRLMDDVSGQVTKGHIVYAHNRLYALMVFTMKDVSLNEDIDKFLKSFVFTH